MSSKELAVRVSQLSKCYQIYSKPQHRLWQSLLRGRRQLYREFWALNDVSFEVSKGETLGIIGRNGSGKSTLLQMICGTLTPTSGEIMVNGRVAALLELGAGFNVEFTGRENVMLNAALLGLTPNEIDESFDQIAAFADIGEYIDQPVKTYSSGMFARLAFAVAVHVKPELLIVDEILAVGDAAFQRRCIEKFYEIRESGCTILFVSHDTYQVKSVCQRAIYLDRGCLVDFGPAGPVIDHYMTDVQTKSAHPRVAEAESPVAKAKETNARPVAQLGSQGDIKADVPERLFKIESVALLSTTGEPVSLVHTGETVVLRMQFAALTDDIPERVSFVFNLYRHDGFYVCGTTTLMDGLKPTPAGRYGTVSVTFPGLPLLSGAYKWRVAINDDRGFIIHAEVKDACPFRVGDNFNAVGLVTLPRSWDIQIQ